MSFKIASFNVNSIKMRLPNVLSWLDKNNIDVILMQETKTMAVPKSKISKSKRDMRRAHDSLKSDAYVEDKVTGELHRPHHIDLKTGMYGGKQVLKVKDRF